jgi:hypothetical protein
MRDFIQVDPFKNTLTNEVFIEMKAQYRNRIKTQKYFQRECSFFHQFKDEEINGMVNLNGRYLVDVVFTPDDNWFIIDSITIIDGGLRYPYDFESSYRPDSVYKSAESYISDNNLHITEA